MTGFPPDTLAFLEDLRAHNDKAWFDANRDRYDAAYVAPAKAFVEEVGATLDAVVPGIRAEPKVLGSIFRINRDTRFSKDKRPYKDHLDLWFSEGDRKSAPSGLFFRVSPDGVIVGAGSHGFTREQLPRYRDRADAGLLAIVEEIEGSGYRIGGETYARVPRGHDADAPVSRLLRHSALHAFVELPAGTSTSPALSRDAVEHWRLLAPLHRWLVDGLSG